MIRQIRMTAGMRLKGWLFAGALVLAAAMPATAQENCTLPLEDVFEAVEASVVSVVSVGIGADSGASRVRTTSGTGVVVDDAGHVVTNAHVVYGGGSIVVATSEQRVVAASLVGLDPILDIAVLQLDDGAEVTAAKLGDSDGLRIGQEVMAVGNTFGLGLAATRGIVSGLNRVVRRSSMSWLTPLIQTDAAINAGSSGGPLVDRCGAVVGINTFRFAQGGGAGFAVPANTVAQAIAELQASGQIQRPWHGIDGKMVSLPLVMLMRVPLVRGFLVEKVEPGSAAAAIGLQGGDLPVRLGADEYLLGGDIITRVDGRPIENLKTAMDIVKSLKVGDEVTVEFFRDGLTFTAQAVLPARPTLDSDLDALRARQADYRSGFNAESGPPAD